MRILLAAFKHVFYGLLICFILLASLALFLLTTTPGLYISLKLASLYLPGKITVAKLDGRVANHLIIGELTYQSPQLNLQIEQLDLHWHLQDLLQKRLVIELLTIGKLHYAGQEISQLHMQGQATKQLYQIDQLDFIWLNNKIMLQGEVGAASPWPVNTLMTVKPLQVLNPGLQGTFKLKGNLNSYEWTVQTIKPQVSTFHGTLTQGSLFNALFTSSTLAAPFDSVYINGQINGLGTPDFAVSTKITARYNDARFEAIVRFAAQTLNATFSLGSNQMQIHGKVPTSFDMTARFPDLALLHPALANLKTAITAKATLNQLKQGNLFITLQKGQFALPDGGSIPFDGGEFKAVLDSNLLNITSQMHMDKDKSLQLALNMPQFDLMQINPRKQRLNGQLILDVQSLAFVQKLLPTQNTVQGKLRALVDIRGTMAKPALTGDVSLIQTSLNLPQLGLKLDPIQFSLKSRDNKWTANSKVMFNGQPLSINGKGDFAPVIKGLIAIDGSQIPVINNGEYVVNASPKLTFEFNPSMMKIRGAILIPKAELKPRSFTDTTRLSDDAVFVSNDKTPPPNPLHLDTDIRIDMGDEVTLAAKGLQGSLTGGVRLKQLPMGPLTASGELAIKDGKYRAYGQDLSIEQGQLIYSGGLLDNPGIRVRASRQFKNSSNAMGDVSNLFDVNSANVQTLDVNGKTTVGIEVDGHISKPKVRLFSIPTSMSQADILSMLLLGKPANQASKSGGQLLLAAVSALKLDSGTGGVQMLDQLKQKLGIDFNLTSNTQYNQKTNQSTGSTALVIGKSISKRLYVSYNVGLSQKDSNVLTLSYFLNKFFSIQVNASTIASGIDLLYTHRKD